MPAPKSIRSLSHSYRRGTSTPVFRAGRAPRDRMGVGKGGESLQWQGRRRWHAPDKDCAWLVTGLLQMVARVPLLMTMSPAPTALEHSSPMQPYMQPCMQPGHKPQPTCTFTVTSTCTLTARCTLTASLTERPVWEWNLPDIWTESASLEALMVCLGRGVHTQSSSFP